VFVDGTNAWIGTTAGTCRVARDALGEELHALKQSFPSACTPPLELASDSGAYQDLISAMDVAVREGFIDVGLSSRDALSIELPSKAPAAHCIAPKDAVDPPPLPAADSPVPSKVKIGSDGSMEIDLPPPDEDAKQAMQVAPVLVVTKTEMLLQNERVSMDQIPSRLATIAKQTLASLSPRQQKACADEKRGLRPALGNFCPLGLLILQADAATPVTVINQLVTIAKKGGYDNLMFAVKNR
jgi:biopolymer transport protein ExbD